MTFQDIADSIKSSHPKHKPTLIGIEGYGGSGKTTFASNLKDALIDAYVINFDDFLIKRKISDADKSGFDKQRLEQQILIPATSNQQAFYQKLLWVENKLSEPIPVPNVSYLIIEGVSCYHPSVAKYYDFKIWVDAPMDVSKARGSKRDRELGSNNDHLWEVWAKTDLEYQEKYHPEHEADLIYSVY